MPCFTLNKPVNLNMKQLTDSQLKIYEFLKRETAGGIPPSVREICSATGLSSTSTVHAHLKTLEKLGYIERSEGRNRGIIISGTTATAQVPILGVVTAGIPITAVENVEGYIPFPDRGSKELFALHVRGMSMCEAGIMDGDYVIAERTPTANNGDIVVAMIEDEATVKRFYRESDCVRLQPENPAFEPIYSQSVSVLGKVIAQVRYY